MVHRVMRNGSMVVDILYIKRGCCTLEDFFFFLLFSISCIEREVTTLKQLWFVAYSDFLDTNFKYRVSTTISLYCYQYHLPPNPPITLERVLFNIPDIEFTVNTVWPPALIMFGITAERRTVICWLATCVAVISWNWMCLHPSNCCRYCLELCYVTCSVYLAPNHQCIHSCDDCIDELSWHIRYDIHQYPPWSTYPDAKVRQWLYFPNELVWSRLNPFCCVQTRPFESLREYWSHSCNYGRRRTLGSISLGAISWSMPMECWLDRSHRLQRRLGTRQSHIWK